MDNKLSIHFGEDKTKSILFVYKFKKKNIKKLNIKYGDMKIKQHFKVQQGMDLQEKEAQKD